MFFCRLDSYRNKGFMQYLLVIICVHSLGIRLILVLKDGPSNILLAPGNFFEFVIKLKTEIILGRYLLEIPTKPTARYYTENTTLRHYIQQPPTKYCSLTTAITLTR